MPQDYFNPESIKPKYSQDVAPGLAGMYYERDRTRYDNMAGLQDIMTGNETKKSIEDLVQGAPVRQAERNAKIEQLPWETEQKKANAQKTGLENDITRGTKDSTIGSTNAKNRGTQRDQELADLENGISIAQSLANIGGSGPDIVARLRQLNLPADHPVTKAILDVSNPDEIVGRARIALQSLSNARSAYRQTMDQERMQQINANYRAEVAADATVRAAQTRREASIKSQLDAFLKLKDEEKLSSASILLMNPDIRDNEQMVKAIEASVRQARQNLAVKAQSKNPFRIPGLDEAPIQPENYDPNRPKATIRYNPKTGTFEQIK